MVLEAGREAIEKTNVPVGLERAGDTVELKVVADIHAWLYEALAIFNADALVPEGQSRRDNHLHF